MDAAGYVLAGGRSTRMGRDKALLPFGGRTLLQHVAGIVREAAGEVTVLGDPEKYGRLGLRAIPDVVPDSGPMGGLLTAMKDANEPRILLVACDMPNLTVAFLRELIGTKGEIVVPDSGRLHPLCAIYARRWWPAVEFAVRQRLLKMHDFLSTVPVQRVPADPNLLKNLNTPEDLQA